MSFIRQKAIPTPTWHVVCDFDGTISLNDTTDQLLNRFARSGWMDIEQQWEQGLIGSKTCMQQQIALLDMSEAEFHDCLDQIEIDFGFIEIIQKLSKSPIQVSIVSDGLDSAIHYILKKYQLNHLPIIANRLIQTADRSWQLEFPYAQSSCLSQSGTCKCKIAQQKNLQHTILIGDGRSDFCLAEQADYVFAKKSLIQHCQARHIQHFAFENLSELVKPLITLLHEHEVRLDTQLDNVLVIS